MLVISRHAQQQIVFPHLGIRVSVLQVRGRLVKLGIDAPASVKVLREEILGGLDVEELPSGGQGPDEDIEKREHRRRNELHLLQLKLQSIQRRIDQGEALDPEITLQWLLGNAESVDRELSGTSHVCGPGSNDRAPRILIVEDCDNERRLMAYVLAQHGFDVHVARDGVEAIEQLRLWGFRPDVVLMDMQMPMANGLETLRRIREDERLADLKVFAVTGQPRSKDDEPVGHGWDGWFQKPINVVKLIEQIRLAVAGPLLNSNS